MHNVYNAQILLEAGVPPETSLRELMMLSETLFILFSPPQQ